MKLEYGQRLKMKVHPLECVLGISFTSSSSELVEHEYTICKYWEDDTDANTYKVKLVPDNPVLYPTERMYSMDLRSSIEYGNIQLLTQPERHSV